MDAVAAADGGGVAVLLGASAKCGKQPVDPVEEQVACPCHLDGERGVQNIGRRHALMDETGLLADMLRKAGQKGDDVMLCFALDLVDAVDVETAPFPDCPGTSFGIIPSSAIASQACASISNQIWNLDCSDQIEVISCLLYTSPSPRD